MNFRFQSHQRLKDARTISYVFENGKKFHYYPLLFISAVLPKECEHSDCGTGMEMAQVPIKIAFSVSKKKMRRAVDRNRIKRLMREAYRLQQHNYRSDDHIPFAGTLGVMALFIGNEMPEYDAVYKSMKRFINQL